MKKLSNRNNLCNELEFISHQNIMCITDDSCHGELTPGDYIYKNGCLVDRDWTCDVCNQYLTEKELMSKIEMYAMDEV